MDDLPKRTIKEWAPEDRPRERMLAHGCSVLSNAELLAIMLGSGTTKETVLDVSKRILWGVDEDLNKLGKLTVSELCRFHGIGKVRAITIAAALELGRRRKGAEITEKLKIKSAMDIFSIFHPILSDLPYEEFWVVLLNRQNGIISKTRVSQGGTNTTVVDVKLIVKPALDQLASAVIAVHNHPSGSLNASREDINVTQKIKTALSYFDILLHDHVIVADNGFLSFANEGLL